MKEMLTQKKDKVIYKLECIQQQLKAPKNQHNSYGGFDYRSCEDIFEAVKPLLKEYDLTLIMSDELMQIGDRYYIKSTAKLTNGIETIENTSYAREEETKKGMDMSQITGASSSYARKYALNGLLQLDDNKDADTNEYQKQVQVQLISAEQVKLIHTLFGEIEKAEKQVFKNFSNKDAKEKVYAKFNVKSSKELTKQNATKMIDLLKEKVGER